MVDILLFLLGYGLLILLIYIGFQIELFISFRRISKEAQAKVDEWNRRNHV